MGKNTIAPKWSKSMRLYIIGQLAQWIPYKDIWIKVTGPDFEKESSGIPPLDPIVHNYDQFRMRCARVPKDTVAHAHHEWQLETGAIRWAEDKARLQGISDLVDKVTKQIDDNTYEKDTTGTLAALVAQLRGLYEQIRKEVHADADRKALSASGTRILLANPKSVVINSEYVSELILVYREEIGGLHNLDMTALSMIELEQLRDAVIREITNKLNAIEEAESADVTSDEANEDDE